MSDFSHYEFKAKDVLNLTVSRCFHSSSRLDGKMKLIKQGIDINKYTLHPLPLPRSGGRGHDGKMVLATLGVRGWCTLNSFHPI